MNILAIDDCDLCGGNNCTFCGDSILKPEVLNVGYLMVEDKLFKIKNYHGYKCSDCGEEYIRQDTRDLFYKLLKDGIYEVIEEEKIPVYDFGDFEGDYDTQLVHRVSENSVYCIDNVPFINEEAGTRFRGKTYQHLRELHKRIEKGEIDIKGEIIMVTVSAT